ncbi:hypothetical protein ABZ379_00105 [Streptomyces canus]|uniref:hypothetical protein n=1 Tax=Streptomyces canus TaxID=58343 RepID=UPI0033EF2476
MSSDDLGGAQAALNAWEGIVDAAGEQDRADLHCRDAEQPLGSVLFTLFAVGTAIHLAGRGMHRLRRCEVRNRGRRPQARARAADYSSPGSKSSRK